MLLIVSIKSEYFPQKNKKKLEQNYELFYNFNFYFLHEFFLSFYFI